MVTLLTIAAGIATGFSILAGLLLLVKLWHEPKFVAGILPARVNDAAALYTKSGHGTAKRVKYIQEAVSQARVYTANEQGSVLIPVLIQNQGHGSASSATVNLEFDTDEVEIRDICTEAMRINAIFGNADNISSKLQQVVAHRRIRDTYRRIGPSGTYIQFVAPFPATAVEVFVVELKTSHPISLLATIRIQTADRILQQNAIEQSLRIETVDVPTVN